jgi:glycosyltransferase involved in cell wall biosynthesis
MRIAIAHDKLWQFGGAERVALAMQGAWPDADLYTSAYDPDLTRSVGFGEVRATFLQRAPRLRTVHHYFLPLYDRAFRSLSLEGYDVVVSSSAMFAKCVRPPDGTPHICYCHTPPRFLWDLRETALEESGTGVVARLGVAAMTPWLRRVDARAARRVDVMVASSTDVARRIGQYYDRSAPVIHPPVDVDIYAADFPRGDHLIAVARLYPHKRIDLAIEACRLAGVPLKVIGEGPDRPRLEALAGGEVEFLGWVPEADKPRLFGSARALIAPQVEDFGIAMAETIAAGTPVVAMREGGAVDIVTDGLTGTFFDVQDADSASAAIRALDSIRFDPAAMRRDAARFSTARFAHEMRECVDAAVASAGAEDQPPLTAER